MAVSGLSAALASKIIYVKLKMEGAIFLTLTGLAGHLVDDGLLNETDAQAAWQQAKLENLPLVSYLIKNHLLTSQAVLECCTRHFGLPLFDLAEFQPKESDLNLLDEELVRRYRLIPLRKTGQIMKVAVSDPSDRSALDALTFHTGFSLDPVLVNDEDLNRYIDKHYNKIKNERLQLKVLQKIIPEENKTKSMENSVHYEEPIIHFVNHLIHHAQQQGASDLHIEPYEHATRIRYRQDGLLYEIAEIEPHLASRVITRLKVMADLDISERRLPQDGRFQIKTRHQKIIDVRISSCPTLQGEKIVLRLLDSAKKALAIDTLGFTAKQKTLFLNKLSLPQGLILVTGPTGSGKTITLYSALNHLNTQEKNILTVEDPVEIQIKGINQVPINSKAGLDFATTLRAFLRQDPDIIMVGEIRDKETAEIALEAAQTGHLVLSTLHTNNASETLTRLISMGIAPYQLVPALTLIVAQRLIRKLCSFCKQHEKNPRSSAGLNNHKLRAYGCRHCRQGYSGRTAIFENLAMSDELVQLIMKKANVTTLLKKAKTQGFITLWETGLEKIQQGETSLAELNRVLVK